MKNLSHVHSVSLIKDSMSEGHQYFYTVKCGLKVAPETQNKPALLPVLVLKHFLLLSHLSLLTHTPPPLCFSSTLHLFVLCHFLLF